MVLLTRIPRERCWCASDSSSAGTVIAVRALLDASIVCLTRRGAVQLSATTANLVTTGCVSASQRHRPRSLVLSGWGDHDQPRQSDSGSGEPVRDTTVMICDTSPWHTACGENYTQGEFIAGVHWMRRSTFVTLPSATHFSTDLCQSTCE
ncbi:hypothetical protein EJ04DRAFT_96946 [Polyplosphaeria fusca]|uniref:Uncharacterized protein n=1 Tax=Polyplosphaeria fusca TaxID=682080 RepID=A0A9P4QJL0_9PLEO|nr:hypothetical protein EJ04DRAFT_96946 [Polyplosphaeria fusca]